ncbi:uncharacterized protein DKFZp434B061-like [Odocoileus virginianus]|uniref:Uncharacterized protein DKFZp434B061-like n=1 Tax=Odocoileus virginianus TaxID=9874 RepID=A0ABM4HVU5_ODOVR
MASATDTDSERTLARAPASASPRGPPSPASALEPGRRRPDRSLSYTPPRRGSCPRRLPGAQPRGSRSFQPGPHFSQAGPERATRAGESRPETLLQKRPAGERPPALLHTNHAGDAKASPRWPTSPQQAPQQEKRGPRPQGARALQPGNPSERPHPALRNPDQGRPKGEPRHQRTTPKAPPPRSRTHENTPLLAPSWPGPVGKLLERRREVFPYGAGLHFLLKETRRDFRVQEACVTVAMTLTVPRAQAQLTSKATGRQHLKGTPAEKRDHVHKDSRCHVTRTAQPHPHPSTAAEAASTGFLQPNGPQAPQGHAPDAAFQACEQSHLLPPGGSVPNKPLQEMPTRAHRVLRACSTAPRKGIQAKGQLQECKARTLPLVVPPPLWRLRPLLWLQLSHNPSLYQGETSPNSCNGNHCPEPVSPTTRATGTLSLSRTKSPQRLDLVAKAPSATCRRPLLSQDASPAAASAYNELQ